MLEIIKKSIEPNKKIRILEIVSMVLLLLVSIFSFCLTYKQTSIKDDNLEYVSEVVLYRDIENEDFDEDSKYVDLIYINDDLYLKKTYTYEQYVSLNDESIIAYKYKFNDAYICFDHLNPNLEEARMTYKNTILQENMSSFNLSICLFILFLSLSVILLFGKMFTTYEKIWFITIMSLASIIGIIFPEESANGVSGIIIMLLYLLDTFLNILCELLISKQSRFNFLVSLLVEITEILITIVLMYRFATMVTTLFFWIPIDIISFINWSKHKDEKDDDLTIVRKLKGYQEVLIIIGIIIWTVVVGYFLSGLDIKSDFIQNKSLETIIAYIDACASAVGVVNGLFILFRLEEQWIAWYICAALESIINILSGQYVLLVLKLGYFSNTTYGYIKWNKYIKSRDKAI